MRRASCRATSRRRAISPNALAHARRRAERAIEARALWLLGSVEHGAGQDNLTAAGDRYAAAIALADELG